MMNGVSAGYIELDDPRAVLGLYKASLGTEPVEKLVFYNRSKESDSCRYLGTRILIQHWVNRPPFTTFEIYKRHE